MKTLKVGIASYEAMKARTLAVARGELKPKAGDPKVWFTSPRKLRQGLVEPQPCTACADCRHPPGVTARACRPVRAHTGQPVANATHDGALRPGAAAQRRARHGAPRGALPRCAARHEPVLSSAALPVTVAQHTSTARKSLTLVNVGPGTTRSASGLKKL